MRKYIFIIILIFLINHTSIAQTENLGLQFKVNSDVSAFKNKKEIKGLDAIIKNRFSFTNYPNLEIGGIYYRRNYLYGAGILISTNTNFNLIAIGDIDFYDQIEGKEYYIIPDEESLNTNEEELTSSFGFNLFFGYCFKETERYKINTLMDVGFLTNRNIENKATLKELNSNNYYRAKYALEIRPLYYVSPRIEFEYKFKESSITLNFQYGLNVFQQNYFYNHQVSYLENNQALYNVSKRVNKSDVIQTISFGLRMYIVNTSDLYKMLQEY